MGETERIDLPADSLGFAAGLNPHPPTDVPDWSKQDTHLTHADTEGYLGAKCEGAD